MLLRTRSNYFGFCYFLLYRLLFLFFGGGGPGEKDLIGEGGGGCYRNNACKLCGN